MQMRSIRNISLTSAPHDASFITDFRKEEQLYRELVAQHPDLREIISECKDVAPSQQIDKLKKCVSKVFLEQIVPPLLSIGQQPFLFASHGPWQPDSRITRHHGLWGNAADFPPHMSQRNQVSGIIAGNGGIRYSSIVPLDPEFTEKIVHCIWSSDLVVAMFFSRRSLLDAASIKVLTNDAFGAIDGTAETRLQSVRWVTKRVESGDLVVWPSGNWEDQAARIHIIGAKRDLPASLQK
jgi:hypothetical protein